MGLFNARISSPLVFDILVFGLTFLLKLIYKQLSLLVNIFSFVLQSLGPIRKPIYNSSKVFQSSRHVVDGQQQDHQWLEPTLYEWKPKSIGLDT